MRVTDPDVRESLTLSTQDVWMSLEAINVAAGRSSSDFNVMFPNSVRAAATTLEHVAFRNLVLLTGSSELARQVFEAIRDGRTVREALGLIAGREEWVR